MAKKVVATLQTQGKDFTKVIQVVRSKKTRQGTGIDQQKITAWIKG